MISEPVTIGMLAFASSFALVMISLLIFAAISGELRK